MTIYRHKPVLVDAYQWRGEPDPAPPKWLVEALDTGDIVFSAQGSDFFYMLVETPHGTFTANYDDWIVLDGHGHLTVVKENMFPEMFEPLETPPAQDDKQAFLRRYLRGNFRGEGG